MASYPMPGLTEDISTGNIEYSSMINSYPPLQSLQPDRRDIVLSSEYINVDLKPSLKHNPVISELSMHPPDLSFQRHHVVNAQLMSPIDNSSAFLRIVFPLLRALPCNPNCPIGPPVTSTTRDFASRVPSGRRNPRRKCNRCDQCGHGKYNFCVIYFRELNASC